MKTLISAIAVGAALAAAVATSRSPADLPATEAVLARFADAVGGRTALERLAVRRYRGTIVQDLTWTDPRHQETPFLAEADAQGAVRYAETGTWAALPDTDAVSLDRKIRWLLHPRCALRAEEFFPDLSVSGREFRSGRPVVVLAPRNLKYVHYALFFDEETGLLNHVGHFLDLEDWREADGVLFPHRWVFGRKGGHTTYVFEDVVADPVPGR